MTANRQPLSDAPCTRCRGARVLIRRVYTPGSGTPSGYIIPDLQEFACDACNATGTVPGYVCLVCAGWCYEGDIHAPAVTRDGRCGRCVEHDRSERWLDALAASPGESVVMSALAVAAATGRDVLLPIMGRTWTIRIGGGVRLPRVGMTGRGRVTSTDIKRGDNR